MSTPNQDRIQELRTMPYEEYLKTPEWKTKRDQVLERDGYCCRACNSSENLNVHHQTYARRGNEDLNDLTTFCRSCHEHFHSKMSQAELMRKTYDVPVSQEAQVQKWEDYLIGLLIQNPSLCPHIMGILLESDFAGVDTRELYCVLNSLCQRDVPFTLQYFDRFVPLALVPTVSRIVKSIQSESLFDEAKQVKDARKVVTRIKRMRLVQSTEKLEVLRQEAAVTGDIVTERQLRLQIAGNSKLLQSFDRRG